MDEFRDSNFGMDERATGVSIPVMSSSVINLLYVLVCVGLLVAGWTAARTEY